MWRGFELALECIGCDYGRFRNDDDDDFDSDSHQQPEVAFLFCVKVNEIKEVQYPKDCSCPTCFYFNIYIVTNKRKPHGKMSLGEEGEVI